MTSWQENLFKHSLMKKEKVRLIRKILDFSGKRIFDLGCANGAVSSQLKKSGGQWSHADLDFENLKTARQILHGGLFQQSDHLIPLKDNSFDCVLALDYLEHIEDEGKLLAEIRRILMAKGLVVISTPISGGFFLLNWLKKKLGLKPEIYGHKREGYSINKLQQLLRQHGFKVCYSTTYAKFFVEFFEVLLNAFFIRMNKNKADRLRSGSISPSSETEMKQRSHLLRIYTLFVYPLIYLITRLDWLLWYKTGYATLVVAEKRALH